MEELTSGKHVHVMYTPFIAKLGYAGVYLFFLFLLQNIDCGYSLEPPRHFQPDMPFDCRDTSHFVG